MRASGPFDRAMAVLGARSAWKRGSRVVLGTSVCPFLNATGGESEEATCRFPRGRRCVMSEADEQPISVRAVKSTPGWITNPCSQFGRKRSAPFGRSMKLLLARAHNPGAAEHSSMPSLSSRLVCSAGVFCPPVLVLKHTPKPSHTLRQASKASQSSSSQAPRGGRRMSAAEPEMWGAGGEYGAGYGGACGCLAVCPRVDAYACAC